MSQSAGAERDLQREAEQARYALRSSFYYRVHGAWDEILKPLDLVSTLDWDSRDEWGISDTAWSRVEEKSAVPSHVFCNPSAIEAEPRLIAYYRCLALLPQKGLQRLAIATKNLEQGKGRLTVQRSIIVSSAVNNIVSLLINSDPSWTLERARTAALMNLGS